MKASRRKSNAQYTANDSRKIRALACPRRQPSAMETGQTTPHRKTSPTTACALARYSPSAAQAEPTRPKTISTPYTQRQSRTRCKSANSITVKANTVAASVPSTLGARNTVSPPPVNT
ncbi:hypothetical protein D3C73_788370 [compost metagenome]